MKTKGVEVAFYLTPENRSVLSGVQQSCSTSSYGPRSSQSFLTKEERRDPGGCEGRIQKELTFKDVSFVILFAAKF